jgi:hypothetical protein
VAKAGKLDALDVQARARQKSGQPSDPQGRKVTAEEEVAKVGKQVARAAIARHRQANGKPPSTPKKKPKAPNTHAESSATTRMRLTPKPPASAYATP